MQTKEVNSRRKCGADSTGWLTWAILKTLLQHESVGKGINGFKKRHSPTAAVQEAEDTLLYNESLQS